MKNEKQHRKGKQTGYASLATVALVSGMGATPVILAKEVADNVRTEQVTDTKETTPKTETSVVAESTVATKPESTETTPAEVETQTKPAVASSAVGQSTPEAPAKTATTSSKIDTEFSASSASGVATETSNKPSANDTAQSGISNPAETTNVTVANEDAKTNNKKRTSRADVPNAPAIRQAVPGDSAMALGWSIPADNGDPITGYSVQYKVNGQNKWQTWVTEGTATVSTITGLTNGTTYNFRVAAINESGPGAYSATMTAMVVTTPAPPVLTATPSVATVDLSWSTPNNGGYTITGYTIQYKEHAASDWQTASFDGTGTTTSIGGLTNGVQYDFRIAAKSNAGTGEYGQTTAMPLTVPSAPVLTATAGDASVNLSWTAPDDGGATIMGYLLRYKDTDADESVEDWHYLTLLMDGTATTVSGLVNGDEYIFQIAAQNSVGTGEYGETTAIPWIGDTGNSGNDDSENNTGDDSQDNSGNDSQNNTDDSSQDNTDDNSPSNTDTPPTDTEATDDNTEPTTEPVDTDEPTLTPIVLPDTATIPSDVIPTATGTNKPNKPNKPTPAPNVTHLPASGGAPASVQTNNDGTAKQTPTTAPTAAVHQQAPAPVTSDQTKLVQTGLATPPNYLLVAAGAVLGMLGLLGLTSRKRRK